jgi:hypothetical protein
MNSRSIGFLAVLILLAVVLTNCSKDECENNTSQQLSCDTKCLEIELLLTGENIAAECALKTTAQGSEFENACRSSCCNSPGDLKSCLGNVITCEKIGLCIGYRNKSATSN